MLEENAQVEKFQNIIGNVLNELEENAGLYHDQKAMTHSFRFNNGNNALVMISPEGGVICYGSSVHPMGQIKLSASPMEFLQSIKDFKLFFANERAVACERVKSLALKNEEEQIFDITKSDGNRQFSEEPSEEIEVRPNHEIAPYSKAWLKARHLDDCTEIIRWYNHEHSHPDFAGQDLYQTDDGDFYLHRHGKFDQTPIDEVIRMSNEEVVQFLTSDFEWNSDVELAEYLTDIGLKNWDGLVATEIEDVTVVTEKQGNAYLQEFEDFIPESELTQEQILNLKKHKGRTDILNLNHQGLELD